MLEGVSNDAFLPNINSDLTYNIDGLEGDGSGVIGYDCNETCNGTMAPDCAFPCSSNGFVNDCAGECGGMAITDCNDTCVTYLDQVAGLAAEIDCDAVCGGDALEDCLGNCSMIDATLNVNYLPTANPYLAETCSDGTTGCDCAGVCDGSSINGCTGCTTSPMFLDCFGDCAGVGQLDCADECYYSWTLPNNAICNSVCDLSSCCVSGVIDACGVCDGTETIIDNCP